MARFSPEIHTLSYVSIKVKPKSRWTEAKVKGLLLYTKILAQRGVLLCIQTSLILAQSKHTGLCSKGTSISIPGSQLLPEDPLVSPPISSFMALTLMETR